jgi:IS5 family transposase
MEKGMETRIITTYVVCDEVLKALELYDDNQALMSNAEVVTFGILASYLFGGNHDKARWFCKKMRYFPNILSKSRLNRRIHRIPMHVWMAIFHFLAQVFQKANSSVEFAVDSFPVASCQKCRIDKRKLFRRDGFLGWSASKRKYFCGIKVHMVVTAEGSPVEMQFHPASENDLSVLWKLDLNLPTGSRLYADGAYTCHELEDLLLEDEGVSLLAKRSKTHKKRLRCREQEKLISSRRQIVETAFSCITDLLPRYIHAVTERGFLLRVLCAILAYSMTHFA